MLELEKKKLDVELLKVQAAKADLECRVLEREQDIARMMEAIKIQEDKEAELIQRKQQLK